MARMVKGKVLGVKALLRAAYANYNRTFAGTKRGLKKAANFLLARSREVVPVDTGALYRSGKVETHGRGYATAEAVVSYNTHYALYVHEDLTMSHKPGKTAKYLEGPARRYRREMAAIVRKESEKK